MKIVLIGYRGTGKSAVGQMVADRLRLSYVGMDAAIVEKAGMPIPKIVATLGWTGFRDIESALAKELAEQDKIVVDTGGGIIERPANMAVLGANAVVIWLKASVGVIVARIEKDTQRPALTEGKSFTEEVAEVLSGRIEKYQAAAQYAIDTDHLSIAEIANLVTDIWNGEVGRG